MILRIMGENQGWQVGELWEVDESRQYLRCVDIWHTDDFADTGYVEQRRALRIAPDVDLAGRVWQRHLPLWIPDLAEEPMLPLAILAKDTGLHGAFAIPLRNGPEVIGVMSFFSSEVRQANDDHLSMLSALGGQIGQFMERKRMEQGLRDSEERYRSVIAALDEGIVLVDSGGRLIASNASAERILARASIELLGSPGADPFASVVDEDERTVVGGRPAVPGHVAHRRGAPEPRPRRDPEGRQPRLDLDELAAAGALRRDACPTRRWRRSATSRRARRPRSRCARPTRTWRTASRSAPPS